MRPKHVSGLVKTGRQTTLYPPGYGERDLTEGDCTRWKGRGLLRTTNSGLTTDRLIPMDGCKRGHLYLECQFTPFTHGRDIAFK